MTQRLRTLLTTLGLCVGIASLVIFTGLSAGLNKSIYNNIISNGPLTELTVQGQNSGSSLLNLIPLTNTTSQITPQTMVDIEKILHVTKVYPEMNYGGISSLQISILGKTFQTDMLIFGLPTEYIQDTLKTPALQARWNNAEQNYPNQPYPAIISSRIIDLYNFTVASSSQLPHLSQLELNGLPLTILPNESTFLNSQNTSSPNPLNAQLIGFSDKTSLVGITLPIDVVRKLNQDHNPNYQENYLHLYVEIDSAEHMEEVQQAIQKMGLQTTSSAQEIQTFEQNFRYVNLGLSMISLIILIVSGLMIANTFFASISERKNEIGIFRALGATRINIQMIFLTEASVLGVIGGIIGIILGLGSEYLLNGIAQQLLSNISANPMPIFANDPISLVGIFLFSILISIIFALIPATHAAYLEPLDALNE